MCVIAQTNIFKLDKFILRLNQYKKKILCQIWAKLPMKKDEVMNSEQMMTQSTSNFEPDNESANNSLSTFYAKNKVSEPSEMLMSLILPIVSNQLKHHQEVMKLKGSNT